MKTIVAGQYHGNLPNAISRQERILQDYAVDYHAYRASREEEAS